MMAMAIRVAAAETEGRFVPFRVPLEVDFVIGFKYTACYNPSQGAGFGKDEASSPS
jgi:hypothetical protein